jgi:hypothetical protein
MKSCYTCLYRATHEQCDGCLCPPGWVGTPEVVGESIQGDVRKPIIQNSFAHANWVESSLGEALERIHALEVSGGRNIVIGGSGEAEINAKWTVREAYKKLCYVSECCGYMTRAPVFDGDKTIIVIAGSWNGPRYLIWVSGVFERIEKENGVCTWERHPKHIKTQLGKAFDMKGTPKELCV